MPRTPRRTRRKRSGHLDRRDVVGNDGESVYTGEDSFAFTVTKVDQTDAGNPGYTIKQVSSGRYLAVTQSLQQPVDAYIYYVYRPGGSEGYAELAAMSSPPIRMSI